MKPQKLLMLLFITSALFAQIKYVPTDYSMIQFAINDAVDGDTIIVEEGIYCQQINFKGKAITVASRFYLDGDTSHISKTIIDGIFFDKDSSSLVYFVNGEDSTSVLSGFTLQNGKGTLIGFKESSWLVGGAIYMENSGATIAKNYIKNNSVVIDDYLNTSIQAFGGAIELYLLPKNKTVLIKDNFISNNKAQGVVTFGGGIDIFMIEGNIIVSGNRILDNSIKAKNSGYGGGITITDHGSDVIIENNYIAHNSSYSSIGHSKGAGIAAYFAEPIIRNNIIVYNKTDYPLQYAVNAFGGGIAVFWNIDNDAWDWIVDPYNLVAIIENNTIAYNNDHNAGGGLAFRDVGAIVRNNIIGCNFSENDAQIKVKFLLTDETKARSIKVSYCNVEGGYPGVRNINQFPEYYDKENWFLKEDISPCIDAGDPLQKYQDIADQKNLDQACFPALGTTRNDIGAFGGPHSKWTDMLIPTSVKENQILIPKQPELSQNYPNPFNPSTTIKYSIPRNSGDVGTSHDLSVQLKIYDVLGKEITTLVNKQQKPGYYEVNWNAANQASGIYFYKLSVGSFVSTKKMILLR